MAWAGTAKIHPWVQCIASKTLVFQPNGVDSPKREPGSENTGSEYFHSGEPPSPRHLACLRVFLCLAFRLCNLSVVSFGCAA